MRYGCIKTITCNRSMRKQHYSNISAKQKIFAFHTILYKNLKLLKPNDVYKLELAKSMHQLYNQKLPQPFGSLCNVVPVSSEPISNPY